MCTKYTVEMMLMHQVWRCIIYKQSQSYYLIIYVSKQKMTSLKLNKSNHLFSADTLAQKCAWLQRTLRILHTKKIIKNVQTNFIKK